jgi:hypothetical protein
VVVTNPSEFPSGKVEQVFEPVVRSTILAPSEYVGTIMELCQQRRVILGVHDNSYPIMVLGSGPDHGRSADVDVLYGVVERRAFRAHGFERIEIADEKIDALDAMRAHRLGVVAMIAQRKQAPMNRRMQRLDATAHDFGKTGYFGHIGDGDPCVAQAFCRSPGRKNLHTAPHKCTREIDEPGFVRNGDQGAAKWALGHRPLLAAEEPKEKGEAYANHKRGDDGEIETEITALDGDISGKPAEP